MASTLTTPLAASGSASGTDAVVRAVEQSLAGLGGAVPAVVFVFPPCRDGLAGEVALAQTLTAAPVVGMTGNSTLCAGGASDECCCAIAFAAPCAASAAVVRHASRDPVTAGHDAAVMALGGVEAVPGERVLIMLVDTRSGDQADVIAGAYEAAGPGVPLAGGAAGGANPEQIAEGSILTDAVIAVAVVAPVAVGVGLAHGCQPRGAPSIVTKADGRAVLQLDGRRAEDVYLEKLGFADEVLADREFERLAVIHPLAQPELSGDVRLRHVLGRTGEGGLMCATHLPANAAVEFTDEEPEGIVVSAWDAVTTALGNLHGAQARAALVFDCAGRKRALEIKGEALESEARAVISSFGEDPPPLAGLYTHGEIGRVRGAKGDRNHAVVVVAIA